MYNNIESISLITLPYHRSDDGELVVMESGNIPFSIARVFTIRANSGSVRGQHAHRQCVQFLTCNVGSVEVYCDDGEQTAHYLLNKPNQGLLIPAGIWAAQTYMTEQSVLTVLCDRPYEAIDYIRDYQEYIAYRQMN